MSLFDSALVTVLALMTLLVVVLATVQPRPASWVVVVPPARGAP